MLTVRAAREEHLTAMKEERIVPLRELDVKSL